MTFSWRSQYVFITFSWRSHDVLMTFSWHSHDVLMTFSWRSQYVLMTLSWRYYDVIMTLSWRSVVADFISQLSSLFSFFYASFSFFRILLLRAGVSELRPDGGCGPRGPLIRPVETFLCTEKNYGNLRVSCQDQPPLTWTLCFYRIKIEARSSALCFPTDHYIAKPYSLLTFSTSVHSQWDDITPSSGGVFKLFAACSRLDYFDHSLPVAVDCCDEEVLVSVSVWLRNMLHSILFSDNFLRVITYHCDHLSTISG